MAGTGAVIMEPSTRHKAVVTLAVVIAAVAGMVVIRQTTNSASPPTGRTLTMPLASNDSDSPVDENDKEWKSRLTHEQYMVTRKKATEAPWSGKYWNNKGTGVYKCICCGTPLFDSSTKFEFGDRLAELLPAN